MEIMVYLPIPNFSCLMSNPNKEQFSEETKRIWDRMAIFKQRYQEYSNKVKSLEEALAVVNLELSLIRNENARLKEELKIKQASIAKYQQILKELVAVEDRYRTLLQVKKNSDHELAAEKKLRLDLERRHVNEKKEIQRSLQEEFRILRNDSALKEEITIVEYSRTMEDQNKEIDRLNQKLSENVKKYEEQLLNMGQDLKNAEKEIDDLKRGAGSKKVPTASHVESPSKKESTAGDKNFHSRDTVFKNNKSLRSTVADSQQSLSEKKGMKPLEVFRLPTRSCKNSPIRKKRKLYSRSDDTL